MALLIEAPETIHLIDEVSKLTGESAETVITVAVREQLALLDEVDAEVQRRAEIYALVKELGTALRETGIPTVDHGELLYDENGLPREGDLSEYELRFYFPGRYTRSEDTD